jgi:hypothetical protein
MAGGTGMSATTSKAGVSAVRTGDKSPGRGGSVEGSARTFGGEGVAHPLLVDDVDEDAHAQALLLLQPAHLLLRGSALVFLFPTLPPLSRLVVGNDCFAAGVKG